MTIERFTVPEPSDEATKAYFRSTYVARLGQKEWVAAAYAVDVPRIVRAEVERALTAVFGKDGLADMSVQRYLAARFGEPKVSDALDARLTIGPEADLDYASTPTRPRAGYFFQLTTPPPVGRLLSPAEGEFLQALAEERVVDSQGPRGLLHSPTWEAARVKAAEATLAAARKVVEGWP